MNLFNNIFKRRAHLGSSFVLFVLSILNAPAQDYYFENVDIDTIIVQDEIDLFAKIKIPFVNNLNDYTTFQWIKNETNLPENWLISVCDEANCYDPEIEMGLSTIPANSNYEFAIQVYPFDANNQVEFASASMTLEVAADINNIQIATVDFEIAALTNNQIIVKNNIKIYPNPSTSFVNFTNLDDTFYQVEIYDLLGNLIHTSFEKRVDISNFSNGTYLVNFIDRDQKLLNTQKIVVDK